MNKNTSNIIVLGKGPIGIYTSYFLLKNGNNVINIDSGIGLKHLKDKIIVDSNIDWKDKEQKPSLNYKASDYAWTGACMGLNKKLFSDNKDTRITLPVTSQEIDKSYNAISDIFNFTNFDFQQNIPTNKKLKSLDNNFNFIFAKVTKDLHFTKIQKYLEENKNYKFIDNSIAKKIYNHNSKHYLQYYDFPSLTENILSFDKIFLCLGTVENTRLLLSSRKELNVNENFLGKNLSDHISINFGKIYSNDIDNLKTSFFYQDEDTNSRVWPRLEDKTSELDSFCYIDSFHSRKMTNIKKLVTNFNGNANLNLFVELTNINTNNLSIINESGIPDLKVSFRVLNDEVHKFKNQMERYKNYFKKNYANVKIKNNLIDDISKWETTNHPSGTTIMSDTSENGVVDKYSRLWNHDNIYVYGSSVFPASSNFHPTFAALALADFSLNNL